MSDMATDELRRLSVDDFYRMAAAGIIGEDERVELLDGMLVRMSPAGKRHEIIKGAIEQYLAVKLGNRAVLAGSASLPLGRWDVPQPDVLFLAPATLDDLRRAPLIEETLLVVEVAESSLQRDTVKKRETYARFGIPDYLVSDLSDNVLLHFSRPNAGRYGEPRRLVYGDTFELCAFPGLSLLADPFLLPRRRTPPQP